MTRKRSYSLEEAKAFRDKLAELGDGFESTAQDFHGAVQEALEGAQGALEAVQEALAPLREASRDEDWVRNFVVDMARRTLSEVGPDSKIGDALRDCLSNLPNHFAIVDDARTEPATRHAAMEHIIADVLYIGLASNDPNDRDLAAWRRKDVREKQAAAARKKKADEFAARAAEDFAAVRAAMKKVSEEPADSDAYAKLVKTHLGKRRSLSTIRRRVRFILQE